MSVIAARFGRPWREDSAMVYIMTFTLFILSPRGESLGPGARRFRKDGHARLRRCSVQDKNGLVVK